MTESVVGERDSMDQTVTLIEQLVSALELREASDPDSPAWFAEREIRHLEHEIMVAARDSAWAGILGTERRDAIG